MHLISAGAAKGLVEALRERFENETGARIDGTFGAVGAMKEKLVGGAPCDVVILTQPLLEALAEAGRVRRETIAPLGRVYTGVAIRAGDPDVDVGTPDALRDALLASTSVHFPDPDKATAGIHFMRVLDGLGVRAALAGRQRPFPNGATAMAALARAQDARPIGCTQVTEILYTPGVTLVAKLPREYELATLYCVALVAQPADARIASRLIDLLSGPSTASLRRQGGFE